MQWGVTVTALTVMQALRLTVAGHPVVEYAPSSAGGPAILGVPTASVDRIITGSNVFLYGGVHGCVPDRVGGHLSGNSDRWWVAFKGKLTQPP